MTASRTIAKVMRYELSDVLRSRWLLTYFAFFLIVTETLLRFTGSDAGGLLGLMNIVLLVVPLVAVVFGTMYFHHSREFVELLLAQPVRRRHLFTGLYLGLVAPLAGAFFLSVGVPLAVHLPASGHLIRAGVMLLAVGIALTAVFVALALLIAVAVSDSVRGLGLAIGCWLVSAVLYDGAVLLLAMTFANHPIERPLLGLVLLNPVDLGRVLLLLEFDVSALMGYTGAVFKRFFGSASGIAIAASALLLWAAVPAWLGLRAFERKDF
jgi:Cu-processing system permease protein